MTVSSRVDEKRAKSRSRLTKLELDVAALPEIPQRNILKDAIKKAKEALEANDAHVQGGVVDRSAFCLAAAP